MTNFYGGPVDRELVSAQEHEVEYLATKGGLSEEQVKHITQQIGWRSRQETPIELSVVAPTFNEVDNVQELSRRVCNALEATGIGWELVFVDDDSTDNTAAAVRKLARVDRRIRCLHRIGRRGLSSACIEGMLASSAPYIAVIDADLQHDETRLAGMIQTLRETGVDLVVGSRYISGGSVGRWDDSRASMSRFATRLSRIICKQDVSDPMSGFFMIRREAFDSSVRSLSALGFKILLDILASAPQPLKIAEVPYTFRPRMTGESKLDSLVLWEFGMLLADKTVGRFVPVRFISFAAVGAAGVVVHMAVLAVLITVSAASFTYAQAGATIIAMVFNFWLNNLMTYRDRRLQGLKWFSGLVSFTLACSVGALANVGIASYLFDNKTQWALAGLAGIVVGAVWNYAITQIYTWGRKN
ncbi:MAG: glycosyltransferase family 2 protein [Burkholderiaceae bacterium]